MAHLTKATATIAASGTTSGAIPCNGAIPVALQFPTMTGTAMTFHVSLDDGATFTELVDTSGAAVSITVPDNKVVTLAPSTFAGVDQFKLVSGSSEAAAREIIVALHKTV